MDDDQSDKNNHRIAIEPPTEIFNHASPIVNVGRARPPPIPPLGDNNNDRIAIEPPSEIFNHASPIVNVDSERRPPSTPLDKRKTRLNILTPDFEDKDEGSRKKVDNSDSRRFFTTLNDNTRPEEESSISRHMTTAWNFLVGFGTFYCTIGESIYILSFPNDTTDIGMGIILFFFVIVYFVDMTSTALSQGRQYFFSVFFILDSLSLVDLAFTGVGYILAGMDSVLFFRIMRVSRVAKMSSKAGRLAKLFNFTSKVMDSQRSARNLQIQEMFTEEQLMSIVNGMDTNGDGVVDFEEFKTCCEECHGRIFDSQEVEKVKKIFEHFDANGDGIISEEEVMEVFDQYETNYVSENGEKGLRIEKEYNQRATHHFVAVVFLIFFVPTLWETLWQRNIERADAWKLGAILMSTSTETGKDALLQYFGSSVYSITKDNATIYQRSSGYRRVSEVVEEAFNGTVIKFDLQDDAIFDASVQIISTVFVASVLLVSNTLMLKQAHELLIQPLEKTMRVVSQLRTNPMAKIVTERDDTTQIANENENLFIVGVISKLAKLLQLMVGSAGADIISRNIRREGTISIMHNGIHVDAVYAFFDIRNFTGITEKLQGEVMIFVNLIASVIHKAVKGAGGFPNKNIGDAFLVVWKTNPTVDDPNEDLVSPSGTGPVKPVRMPPALLMSPEKRSRGVFSPSEENVHEATKIEPLIASCAYPALLACLFSIASIKASEALKTYASGLHLSCIEVGCGIHYGWAIEGAVGSNIKLEATYLSPHVNIASRLESATKYYGVDCIISDIVYIHLPEFLKEYMRLLDRVVLKGVAQPINIYGTAVGDAVSRKMGIDPSFSVRDIRSKVKMGGKEILPPDPNDEDCIANRMYNSAVVLYLEGHWAEASSRLLAMLQAYPTDRPASVMLERLRVEGTAEGNAPPGWPGYNVKASK